METIGNSKCQCIMETEKRNILKALENEINRHDNEIKKIQLRREEIIKNELLTPEQLINFHEREKRDLQMTWKKTDNTPICEP